MHIMHKHTVIPKPEHGSLEWLKLRQRNANGDCILGASEVSTIMGCNPFQTVAELAVQKTIEPSVGTPNDAMVRGNVLEPALITHASNVLEKRLHTPDFMYARGRFIATLDAQGMDDLDLVVEAKTTNSWASGDAFPDSWFWQAQAQMYCTGAPQVIFVILDRRQRLCFEYVQSSKDAQDLMWDRAETFCSAVDRGEIPEEDTLGAHSIAELHPEPAGEVELDHNAIALLAQWQGVKESISLLEQEERTLKDALARVLVDKEYGTLDGRRVLSWKMQSQRRLDAKALAQDYPDIADAYTKGTTFRTMRAMK